MSQSPKRSKLTVEEYVLGVKEQNRAILARAITLVESNAKKHLQLAQDVLTELMPQTGQSIRIGFSGVPGAGKSTLIEAFGMMLCEKGHKVAVLAVDPSSSLTGGSILGDKTRMEQLSRHPNAYVRPSPAGGTLGGVARKTRETLLLCEAAGYDVIIVETVGVGQSEVAVRSMVDFFLVLMLTGAGDELQGMKKGIMEMADAMFINKADGPNKQAAEQARVELDRMLHLLPPITEGWSTKAYTVSALTGEGVDHIWSVIQDHKEHMQQNNIFHKRRNEQALRWFRDLIEEQVLVEFYQNEKVKTILPQMQEQVLTGQSSATKAALEILEVKNEK
ncbi:methylmalonyl Co-A mutase-associated GTPase MeaB [Alkalihalophilus lindianensis]|uniref:Methylmalonyl Co-A mutase-associated GTPase MeaB n=1 Tax=Alkalihalophilus lindianensis TaxID=1630542 RepID=A0ABU3XCB3_9BACI|nr:methylmalonyl Co-A mutase-associated GTPase MeaB [Alkalihalophilus lindianensis]MDV2684963.1 methylmalonyl Co-A mutase-associated GTPase MeaB [Alkalihalophilus lindianensis]